jgi:thiol-disulfide isomerase/thioredoxin
MAGFPARPKALTAALAVAVLGAAAIYVTLDRQSNGAESAACAAAEPQAAALDPLIGGEIAAFLPAKAPQDLSSLSFNDGGKVLTLADFKGKVTLVNLWATWCAPCRREMPALDRLQAAKGGADFQVVPVSIDTGEASRPAEFLKSIGVERLPLYTDSSTEIFQAVKKRSLALGLPVTLLVNRDGCHIGHINGPAEWDSPEALKLIDAAVAARPEQG